MKDRASLNYNGFAAQWAAQPQPQPTAAASRYERDARPEIEAAKNVPWYYYAAGAGVVGGILYYFLGRK